MNKNIKKRLVNIAFAMFIFHGISMLSVIIWILAWHILGVVWITLASITMMLLLISVIPIGNKSEYKKDNAYNEDNSIYQKFRIKISANIRLWVNSCSLKYSKIRICIQQRKGIHNRSKTTDNHSLHTDNVSQAKKPSQPKGNDTALSLFSKGRGIKEGDGLINNIRLEHKTGFVVS